MTLKKPDELRSVYEAALVASQNAREIENERDSENHGNTPLHFLLEVLANPSDHFPGAKVQLKPQFLPVNGAFDRLLVVIKWGGEITHAFVFLFNGR